MLALAVFVAAGAPNAWALLVPARRVTRGSNRILSEASFEELKLVAADAAASVWFGWSVAIDGDTVVIGASEAGTGGAVYVFRTTDDGATYDEVAKLTASDAAAGDGFGHSVAIDGDTVVVGADGKDSYTGAAYVFRTSDGWDTYGQVAKLTAGDAAAWDGFGWSVAIDGATIVFGAWGKDTFSGAVYVFRTSDGGATYDEVVKLTASDAAASDAATGDQFGWSVAIDGDTVVGGAQSSEDYGSSGWGAAYVFRTTDGWATHTEIKLTAADAAKKDNFGGSVAIDGDTVVVGASGGDAAYVFRTSDGGVMYGQVAKLTAADAASYDYFGVSVAIDGGTIVVGDFVDDGGGFPSGAVYVYRTSDGGATYAQVAKLTASDGASMDFFGGPVAIDGGTIVVGAPEDDDGGESSGSAYVYSDAGSEGLVADSDSAQTLGSDAATRRAGPLLALLVAAGLAL